MTGPTETCERILRAGIRYNIDHSILKSENAVAEQLLARGVELIDAYEELHGKLAGRPQALEVFFGALLSSAAFWNPDKLALARKGKERLDTVNRSIASKSAELAALLDVRSALHDHSRFHTDTHYDVCDVIAAAARNNHLFDGWVREKLAALSGQFDLKYWPTLGDVMRELSADATRASSQPSDPLTAAGTQSLRSSRADFFKAFFAAIDENSGNSFGLLPVDLKLSDGTYASLANCALDLPAKSLVDAAYVKRLRQRQREAGKQG